MTTKSPNVFTIIRRKLRKGRSYDLSAQAADEKEVVCLKGVNDVPTSYDQPGVTNTLSPDGDTHSHVNHNGDSINVGPHLNGIHNNIAATIGSTPVSSPMRYCGNRNNRDETVDKSVHSCAIPTKKVSCDDVNSQNQTLVKTWHSRTGSEAFAREVLPTTDTPRMTSLPVVAPPQMTIAKAAPVKEKVVVNSNCVCQKPQPLPEDDDVDIGGGYSVCKDVSRMQVRGDNVKQSTISPGENTSSTGTREKDVPKSSACHLEDAAGSRDDPIHLELVKIKQKIGTGSLNKDSHRPVNSDTFDICQAARSRQMCSSINSTGTVSVTSGDSENSTAESGEEADYTIVGDIEVQVPEDVAVAYQSPSRKSSKAGTGDTRPKVKTVSVKAVTEETERDVVNTSCDSSQPMASQQVLATNDSDDIFVNDDKRVYRKTTEHRLDCSSSSFSQLYASIPKGPVKSQGVSESSNLLEEDGPDDSSSGVVTSPDEPKEIGDETGEEECEDNIPPLPSRNYTIQEGEADVNYNVKMMRSISVTSASSTTSTDDEPTHMSWAEVMKEAQTLGIPLRTPSRELGEKLPNSQSTSSMDTSSSSIDTADGCTSPGGVKRPERRRDRMKLPSLVIKGSNVSISDVHAEVTTDMHRRTLPPPPRSPKSASPKVQTSTLGRPRFHSSGHLTSQEVRGSQSRNSLQSLDSGVGQSKSSVSLDTGMSKAKHGTSRESVPSTQGAAAVSEPASSSSNSTDIISSLSKLKDCGWYWGPLNWDDAEAKLADKVDGSFLVRDSSDDRYILSLTFRSQGTTHHTRIEHYKGMFSFYSQPKSHGESTIVEFIEKAMAHSRSGRFLYFLRPRAPGLPPAPIQLLFPVSRFQMVHSLQHVCRFAILKCVRRDHIMMLPVPLRLKEYLQQSQYYTENFSDDYSRYH